MGNDMLNKDKISVIDINKVKVDLEIIVNNCGEERKPSIKNTLTKEVYIKEIIIDFGSFNGFADNAMLFSDGYEMLSNYYKKLLDITPKDGTMSKNHYKMPQSEGFVTGYNYMYVEDERACKLFGATSCNSYRTEFRFNSKNFEVAQILEGRKISPGEVLDLEGYCVLKNENRNIALNRLSNFISKNHDKREFFEVPDGWCSWYCYGPGIKEKAIFKNLTKAKDLNIKGVKYIQIDDGYQPHMGDWLLQTKKFKQNLKDICLKIKEEGFEPAMWVAPFIASKKSQLFNNHPSWFIKDTNGQPLSSEVCTFKGWRDAPWYFLDLTNDEAKKYIQHVFKTMKEDWGVNYFKLDANAWGGLPFGVRSDSNITSVEAYRQGMEVIWEAVGRDTFLLGCNAPMFPSLGVVSGMRTTMDISRQIGCVKALSQQGFFRNWMNNKLWINDPDCLVQCDLSKNLFRKKLKNSSMYRYNAAYIRASGGMVLSGDKLFSLNNYDRRIFSELLNSTRESAIFNFDYSIGKIEKVNVVEYILFNNKDNDNMTFKIPIVKGIITDVFNGTELENNGILSITLKPNDAGWFKLTI